MISSPSGRPPVDHDHYSYAVYADPRMAERFDRLRFSGPIGSWLAAEQERVLADFLGNLSGKTVIDVGTGTGRAAIALARFGGTVTGVDASPEMLAVARGRAASEGLAVTMLEGDAHHLPFPDSSFDVCVSLRVLMHAPDWHQCLGELCRVSRWRIVLDYPALLSGAALQSAFRRVLAAAGRPVEAYRVFGDRTIRDSLERHGYRVVGMHRQFVLPIGFHKLIGSRRVSERLEHWLARVGLLALCGSPVTLAAERR
jgi:SAM-dependent methyltransferase